MSLELDGGLVDIMFDLDPELKEHVRYEKGINSLYMHLIPELYICM